MDVNMNRDPPEASAKKYRKWFGTFNVVYRVNEMQPEKLAELENAPDTQLDPPTIKRMIPLPVTNDDGGHLLVDDEKHINYGEGVVNPAFDTLDRLNVTGNTWSDTSSDNNKDDSQHGRKHNHAGDVTDHAQKPYQYKRPEMKDSRSSTLQQEPDKTATMKSWDVFRVVKRGKEIYMDDAYFNVFRKIVKVIVSIFLTFLILIMTMLSKSTLFLITSNIYSNVTMDCTWANDKEVMSCVRISADRARPTSFHPTQRAEVRWLWALFAVVCTPFFFTFCKCFWRMCFKKTRNPTSRVLLMVLAIETLHTAGLSLFAFYVLPSMDPIRGLMLTFGIGIVPSVLKVFDQQSEDGRKAYIFAADILAVCAQLSVLVAWPIRNLVANDDMELVWAIPVSILLISVSWWENYINRFTKLGRFGRLLREFKHKVRRMRTKIYVITSLWQIVLTLSLMTIMMSGGNADCVKVLYFRKEYALECPHLMNPVGNNVDSSSFHLDALWVTVLQILSCLLCYQFAKTACKIMLQIVCFALPLMLAAPVMAGLFIGGCETWKTDGTDNGLMPSYLYWTCDIHGVSKGFLHDLMADYFLPISLAWWLSFMWVTFHIWLPRVERLVQTERLFVQPLYSGIMLEQSLMLNRRRDDKDRGQRMSDKQKQAATNFANLNGPYPSQLPMTPRDPARSEPAPMIFVCATMWHETEKEMLQILTSIMRLDDDQCARKNAQRFFDVVDPDYYEFEAHIFFDDAYDGHDDTEYEYYVNSFVRQLVRVIDQAASKVHRVPMKLAPPTKYPTPYGGRLEWSLLGSNKLVAHLKDKAKIRHRKRWSQVMYMYYLLGHRLVSQPLDARRKQNLADNTYVLTLDGDVDFKPSAVQLLVDRMKKNEKVGAACGRIHPIGMGPMIWYQKFEYAISHWLQKATEHMIGCVLCSPGCFSLFRASALMDDNVMAKYAMKSAQARHYVQYDQGEDRWLCTLLLQQGYRVEYCAAADALTYAPEGFNEFYNQRRRWSPSTMANIMDLLGDWRNVIKRNENISFLYIAYQLMLFCSSLLTPATIFLLVVGALNTAFPDIDLMRSLLINSIPIALFLIACFFFKSEWQLRLAQVLSLLYALAMMIVVVGLGLNLILEGFCSPTAVFLFFLLGVFIISAILHPQEFYCLLHGALYFLAVPSMSMLLMIYSICNMHVVSWGTRESATAASASKQKAKKPDSKLMSILQMFSSNDDNEDSDYSFSFGNLFKCLCCPTPRPDTADSKFALVLERLENIEKAVGATGPDQDTLKEEIKVDEIKETKRIEEEDTSEKKDVEDDTDRSSEAGIRYNPVFRTDVLPQEDEYSPFWLQDDELGTGRIRFIGREEKTFWHDLIQRYLKPLENDEQQQKKLQSDLLELRNRMSLMFFMLNALFIVIIFTLQYTNAVKEGHGLSIPIPCRASTGKQLTLEPLSMLFMFVYGITLVIQFISMFFHRLGTFLHIISSTDVNCMKPNQNEISAMDIASKIALVKQMQQMDDDDDDSRSVTTVASDKDEDSSITQDDSPKIKRKKTVIRITKRKRHPPTDQANNLGSKFMKNFMDLANDLRKERVSETSDHSRPRGSKDKRRSRKTKRAIASLQHDKNIVLNKADAIETKMKKIASGRSRGAGDTSSLGKVDSWLHLVRDVLTQSRTSLNTITDEEKRSSLPWKNRISRSNSAEAFPSEEQMKIRSLPKRASFAGGNVLNIIADEDETEAGSPTEAQHRRTVQIASGLQRSNSLDNYASVVIEPPPKRIVSQRISEEHAEAISIESESDFSDSDSERKNNDYIELRETSSQVVITLPDERTTPT